MITGRKLAGAGQNDRKRRRIYPSAEYREHDDDRNVAQQQSDPEIHGLRRVPAFIAELNKQEGGVHLT
jgi:hypothetical protein